MKKISTEKKGNRIAIISVILSTIIGIAGLLITVFQPDIRNWFINELYLNSEKDSIKNTTLNGNMEPESINTTVEDVENVTFDKSIINKHTQKQGVTSEILSPEMHFAQDINNIKLLEVENDGILFEKKLTILEDDVFYDGYYYEYHEKYQLSNEFNVIDLDGYGITISVPEYCEDLSFSATLADCNKLPIYESQELGFVTHMGTTYDNKMLLSFSLRKPIIGEYYCVFSIYNESVRENIYIKFETT